MPEQEFTDEEIKRRMDAAVRKALNTPPQHRTVQPAKEKPATPPRGRASKPGKRERAGEAS